MQPFKPQQSTKVEESRDSLTQRIFGRLFRSKRLIRRREVRELEENVIHLVAERDEAMRLLFLAIELNKKYAEQNDQLQKDFDYVYNVALSYQEALERAASLLRENDIVPGNKPETLH